MDLKNISDLLYYEKYDEALTFVSNDKGLPKYYGALVENYILISKGDFSSALEKIDKSINSIKDKYGWEGFSFLVEKSVILFNQRNIEESRSVINEAESILNLSIEKIPPDYHLWYAEYFYQKAQTVFMKTYYETSAAYCGRSIELALELCDNSLLFKYYELLIKSLRWLFDFKTALETCNEYYNLCQKLNDKKRLMLIYSYFAELYANSGNYYESNFQLEKYIKISSDMNNNFGIFDYYLKKSELHILYGEMSIAEEFIKKAVEFAEYSHLKNTELISFYISGRIYLELDQLSLALNYFENALRSSYYDPFNVHFNLLVLYYLIYTNIEIGKIDIAEEYYNQALKINQKITSNFSNFVINFCKALILRQNSRIRARFESQPLFESLIDLPMDVNFRIQVLINLCELLLDELKLYGKEIVLNEIGNYLKLIQSQKDLLKSPSIQAQLIRLQAKLAIIEGDYDKAFDLLNKTQPILKNKNMNLHLRKIDEEIDTLKKYYSEWSLLFRNNENLKKQVERVDFQEFVKFTEDYIINTSQEEQDQGLVFIIVNSSGLSIFSKYFIEDNEFEDQLFAGLLSAINAFSMDTFKTDQPIERIQQGDNTLILKAISNFIICYVFKGSSYFASKKLNDIYFKLQEHDELINELTNNQTLLSEDTQQQLTELVDQCFN